MSDLTLEEMQTNAVAISRALQTRLDRQDALSVAQVDAEKLRDVAWDLAYTKTEGTVQARDAAARHLCVDELARLSLAEKRRDDNKKAIAGLMSTIELYRSLMSGRRDEMKFARIGEGP